MSTVCSGSFAKFAIKVLLHSVGVPTAFESQENIGKTSGWVIVVADLNAAFTCYMRTSILRQVFCVLDGGVKSSAPAKQIVQDSFRWESAGRQPLGVGQ